MTLSISSQYNNRHVSYFLSVTLLCLLSSSLLSLGGITSSTVFGVEAYTTMTTPTKYIRCTTNNSQSSRKCISDEQRQRLITTSNKVSIETEVIPPPSQKHNINVVGSHLWKRTDTLRFAGFPPMTTKMDDGQQTKNHPMAATLSGAAIFFRNNSFSSSVTSSLHLGFWGHSGLLLASTLVVTLLKKVFSSTSAEVQQEQQAGILNRCPWPFIFFHDVKQGMKDTPTWITLTWIGLWRLLKFVGRTKPTVV